MNKLEAALMWLERGEDLLPVQPETKHLVGGFGPYRKRINTRDEARRWFGSSSPYNLAVCSRGDLLALDFDNTSLFIKWSDNIPSQLAITYQETSPHGFHVFYKCPQLPPGIRLVKGVEIKPVIVCAPSRFPREGSAHFIYRPVDLCAEVIQVQSYENVCSSLLSQPTSVKAPGRLAGPPGPGNDQSIIAKIKAGYNLLDYATTLTDMKSSSSDGRWWRGRCPLHNDHNPSFWVDSERGTWGCHTCGIRGDIINLYSVVNRVEVSDAIRALALEVREESR